MQHSDHLIPEQQTTFPWIPLSFLLPLTLLKFQRWGIQSHQNPPVFEWCWEESQDGDCDTEGGPSEETGSGFSPAPGHVVEVCEGGPCHRNSELPSGWQTFTLTWWGSVSSVVQEGFIGRWQAGWNQMIFQPKPFYNSVIPWATTPQSSSSPYQPPRGGAGFLD